MASCKIKIKTEIILVLSPQQALLIKSLVQNVPENDPILRQDYEEIFLALPEFKTLQDQVAVERWT